MSTPERFLAVVSIVSAVSYVVIGGKAAAMGHGTPIMVVTPIVADANDPLVVSDGVSVAPCTFDRAGGIRMSEMFPLDGGEARGDLAATRLDAPAGRRCIDAGLLTGPGRFAVDPSGRLYVSIDPLTFKPRSDAIVKFESD